MWGFFIQPTSSKFGSIPDAISSAEIIEIKTKALNSEGRLQSLEKFPSYLLKDSNRNTRTVDTGHKTSLWCLYF